MGRRLTPVLLALAGVLLAAGQAVAAEKFRVKGATVIYDTDGPGIPLAEAGIDRGDIDALVKLLRANPGITTLRLNSEGGDYFTAFDMAGVLIDFELDTEVLGECSSACAYVFMGGTDRRLVRGGRIGFHQTSWSPEGARDYFDSLAKDEGWANPFDFVSWVYEDTQTEIYERLIFMTGRGVSSDFAIESLKASTDDMWYPYRARLLAAGVLTE